VRVVIVPTRQRIHGPYLIRGLIASVLPVVGPPRVRLGTASGALLGVELPWPACRRVHLG